MNIVTKNIDHLGLVAGMCDEIGIVDLISEYFEDKPVEHLIGTNR